MIVSEVSEELDIEEIDTDSTKYNCKENGYAQNICYLIIVIGVCLFFFFYTKK